MPPSGAFKVKTEFVVLLLDLITLPKKNDMV